MADLYFAEERADTGPGVRFQLLGQLQQVLRTVKGCTGRCYIKRIGGGEEVQEGLAERGRENEQTSGKI